MGVRRRPVRPRPAEALHRGARRVPGCRARPLLDGHDRRLGRGHQAVEYPLATAPPRAPERFRSMLFDDGGRRRRRRHPDRRCSAGSPMKDSYHHADRTSSPSSACTARSTRCPDWLYFRRDHPERAERAYPACGPGARTWTRAGRTAGGTRRCGCTASTSGPTSRRSAARRFPGGAPGVLPLPGAVGSQPGASRDPAGPRSRGLQAGRASASTPGRRPSRRARLPAGSFATGGGSRRAPVRVGLFGLLGSGNIGNDASLESVLGYLRADHPDGGRGRHVHGPEQLTGPVRHPGHPAAVVPRKYDGPLRRARSVAAQGAGQGRRRVPDGRLGPPA